MNSRIIKQDLLNKCIVVSPINTRRWQVQRSIPPGEVLVRLVPCLRRHVISSVQGPEDPLHLFCADIIPAHQIVYQLIVVAAGTHGTTHFIYIIVEITTD